MNNLTSLDHQSLGVASDRWLTFFFIHSNTYARASGTSPVIENSLSKIFIVPFVLFTVVASVILSRPMRIVGE